jgi:nucleotide-binding universal stress UspA family protein
MMLKHVLVPLDGSALSETALQHAQAILMPKGRLTLLSVIELPANIDYSLVDVPLTLVHASAYSEAEYRNIYSRVSEYLKSKAQKLSEKGYEVACLVESGEPARLILETGNKSDVDVIVMTTHGRSGLSRWLFGSVTQKVISQMERPVLVIPGLYPVETVEVLEIEGQNLKS